MGLLQPKRMGILLVGLILGALAFTFIVSLLAGVAFLANNGCAGTNGAQTQGAPASCVSQSGVGSAVVQLALQMANHLHLADSCHGVPSTPDCYNTWYDAQFPPEVIAYGQRTCPGCWAWQNGNIQCVTFAIGAYSQVDPLPATGNAIDFWGLYRHRAGWIEISANGAPAGQRGLPAPGDMIVWQHPPFGHIAIITAVVPPVNGRDGSITVGQANAPSSFYTMPLHPDLSVSTWSGYEVLGYIRPDIPQFNILGNVSGRLVRIGQLDPAQYATHAEFDTWAYSACSTASMTEVINAYGGHYRIHDILVVEAQRGDITPSLGLTGDAGIADTVAQFGFQTSWGYSLSLDAVIATANAGKPVIVAFPPSRYAGGHLLVVVGGDASTVRVADSSAWNRTVISRGQFLAWWAGYSAIVTPRLASASVVAANSSSLVSLAAQDALAAGIPSALFVRQIDVESGFNPQALSSAGAEGIAQFMPETAAALGVNPWNPIAALVAAAGLMASYYRRYGDYARALAAYNAGTGALEHALGSCGSAWLRCLPAETQHYVNVIIRG